MTNIAMESDPFIGDFPMKTSIYSGFSIAMLNNQMVKPDMSFGQMEGVTGILSIIIYGKRTSMLKTRRFHKSIL